MNEYCNPEVEDRCVIYHFGTKHCFRTITPSNQGAGQQCCYNEQGNLMVGPKNGGSLDRVHIEAGIPVFSRFFHNIVPYLDCCLLSDNCTKYYKKDPQMTAPITNLQGQVHINGRNEIEVLVNGDRMEFNEDFEGVVILKYNSTSKYSAIFSLGISVTVEKAEDILQMIILVPPRFKGATTANNSLFTYDEGKSHSSYFDAGYVPIFLDQNDMAFDNATLGQQARDVCGDNKQCLFDIHTTGKVSIGMASKKAVESFVAVINETETPEMGAENSIPLHQRRMQASPVNALFERAVLDALREMAEESSVPSEQIEHAWDPEDCSPRFRVLSDRLTARRLPSPLTTDGIRGKKGYRQGRHVWEITWERDERGSHAVIGIALPQAPLQCLGYIPLIGSNSGSWGWNLSKKVSFHEGEESPYPANNPGFFVPDTVYCILDMDNATLSFATEDTFLGVAFRNLPRHPQKPLCPCASAVYGNCDIKMKYMGRGDNFLTKLQAAKEKVSQPPQSPTVKSPPQSPTAKSPTQASTAPRGPVKSSESYKFHHTCGDNIAVMLAGKKAKRIEALQHFNHGVVLTSQPLQVDELFEVRLDSKVPKWYGSLDIGATTVSPENVQFPSTITSMAQGTTFVLSSDKILNNGKEMTTISKDLDNLSVGDRVGVMRMSDNSLHFFINGVDVGKKIKTIPPVLYGVVDVFGQAEEVTITGGTAETQSSNQDEVDSVSVMVRMNNTINILKEGSFSDILSITGKVAKDILEPYSETDDRKLRQKYGDHLSEIGAPHHLTMLLRRLMDVGMETRDGWVGMYVVRSVFWNYADASLKMARGLGRSGSLKIMLNDLDTCGTSTSKNEKKKFLVSSAINILHNCSKASENRQILCDLRAKERIAPFTKADDLEIVVPALLTLAYITSEEEKKLLEAESRVISYLIGMLRNALGQSDLRGRSEGTTWSCHEIADGLCNLVVNEKNMEVMLDRDVLPLLISLIGKGDATEKECAANILWIIAKTSKGKTKIKETSNAMEELTRLSKSGNQAIQEAAKRVLLELKETRTTQGTANVERRTRCEYQEKCRRFKTSLKLAEIFFDPKYDRCFCTECHASRGDNLYYTRGKPAKDYGIPIGWCRFGLKVHHRAFALDVFNKWHVAFHGTKVDSVNAILECGDLLIPGDVALGGRKLSEEEGHYNDSWKPKGFDTKQIFVSPSVRYSGHNCYAKPKSFQDPSTNKTFSTKAVLQLCIKPESYQVGPQTIGVASEIDPKFSNQEIEWSTKERGSIILYGLLVKLDEAN